MSSGIADPSTLFLVGESSPVHLAAIKEYFDDFI